MCVIGRCDLWFPTCPPFVLCHSVSIISGELQWQMGTKTDNAGLSLDAFPIWNVQVLRRMEQDQGQCWPKGTAFGQFIFMPGKGNSQDWNPCKFLQESSVTYLKEGGMYSGGRTGGRGWPDMATSIRCIARINSSAVSFPSWSMSERFLIQKIHTIQFRKMHASYSSPVICKSYFLTLILRQQSLPWAGL